MAAGVNLKRRKAAEAGSKGGWRLASPGVLWLIVFFVVPLLFVLAVSFLTRGRGGIIEMPLTLDHYARVFEVYVPVIWTSVWISVVTTIICLLVGYPMAFFISTRQNAWVRNLTLFLVILPFWTNFLVRTYAMQTILAREGLINEFIVGLGGEPVTLLYTPFAVVLGLVYGYLPFMILPIYAAAERFDFKFVSAGHDLGANDWRVFWRIVFPMTLPGVVAGCILVFVPCLGTYITAELLGGESVLMIGKLINDQFISDRNFPRGSAVSMVLMALVLVALFFYVRYGNRER
jgi:spermidine/putrescine transport system permease protein